MLALRFYMSFQEKYYELPHHLIIRQGKHFHMGGALKEGEESSWDETTTSPNGR